MEKDKKSIFVSLLLALVCIGLLGYIVYFRVYELTDTNKIDNEAEKNEILESNEEEEEINKKDDVSTITVTENEVKQLYTFISNYSEFRDVSVDFSSLSESTKDYVVINYLNSNCIDSVSVSKDEFLNIYKTIFNEEKTNENGICLLEDDKYKCEVVCDEEFVKLINKFEHFEIDEDLLFIYEKAAHLEHHDDGNIYLRETINSYDDIKSYTNIDDIKIDKISNELPTYKHTFKSNNGSYYWLSSELVKQ